MGAPSLDNVLSLRGDLRAAALRRGIIGRWPAHVVTVAELLTDILIVYRAVREDVEHAKSLSLITGDPISVTIATLETREEEFHFERALSAVVTPQALGALFPEPELSAAKSFVTSRPAQSPRGVRAMHDVARSGGPRDAPSPPSVTREEHKRPAVADARERYSRILDGLNTKILGRPQLCRRLAAVGLGHTLGIPNTRLLIVGATGTGKTHAAISLGEVVSDVWGCVWMIVSVPDLSSTGFKGAQVADSVAALAAKAQAAGNRLPPILILDEADKAGVMGDDVSGNSLFAQQQLQASMLGLLSGQTITPDVGGQVETAPITVIGTGSFRGAFESDAPSTSDLSRISGWTIETAARWTSRIVLGPLSRNEAIELLRLSNRSVASRLGPIAQAIGVTIQVSEEAIRYVADAWHRTGSDFRTASQWLVEAAEMRLLDALDSDDTREIVVTPDDIQVARVIHQHRAGDP